MLMVVQSDMIVEHVVGHAMSDFDAMVIPPHTTLFIREVYVLAS
jgi:hypothetical protein